jgi:hypothetical protein
MKKSLEQKHNLLDAIYDDRLLITIGALWFVFFYVDVTYKGLLPESFFTVLSYICYGIEVCFLIRLVMVVYKYYKEKRRYRDSSRL